LSQTKSCHLTTKEVQEGQKKLRIREFDENGGRMRRPGVTYRCTKCDKIGHNKRRCKSDVQHPEAAKRQVN